MCLSAGESEQPDWVEWARACADRLDPLCENPPSVLDTPDSEMQPIAQRATRSAEYLAENVAETVVKIVLGFTNLKSYSS